MNRDMLLAKRIYESWTEGMTYKQMAVIAARVSIGQSTDGKRDLIFEALCTAMGADWAQMTKAERSRYNAAVVQLRDVGVTPDDITRRARWYKRLHPDWELTPTSLITHWSSLAGDSGKGRPAASHKAREDSLPADSGPLVPPPAEFYEALRGAVKEMP